MPINLPTSTYTKYFDALDSTWVIFGVTCDLVYIEKVEKKVGTFDNIPSSNSINAHRRTTGNYNRSGVTYEEVSKTEPILLKVYWDRKDWVKVSGDISVPDNAIQILFFAKDLPKINRAKYIIVHNGITDKTKIKFQRSGECYPASLRQDKHYGCFLERV
jgi:hypothetical protein